MATDGQLHPSNSHAATSPPRRSSLPHPRHPFPLDNDTVCAKCEKKIAKERVAATDVWSAPGSSGRKIGENKLLSAKARYSPYAPAASGSGSGAGAKGKGKGKEVDVAGGKGGAVGRCEVCKTVVARPGAKYCQGCAYKKGLCALCGKQILDVSGYKQSMR
ncbi:Cysteine-rich PDZ-binding protein [Rhodotorula toruloides]|nr:Cysteine-rich PDZ-binding protein [Rhodotorula toruloides]